MCLLGNTPGAVQRCIRLIRLLAAQAPVAASSHVEDVPTPQETPSRDSRGGSSRGEGGTYDGNYTGSEESVIAQWIKDVSGEDVDPADLQGSLRTGTILCELVRFSGTFWVVRIPFRSCLAVRLSVQKFRSISCAKW